MHFEQGVCFCAYHAGHTSMLLGAAKLLKEVESSIPGTVKASVPAK